MTVSNTDFDKIWASASPLVPYEFNDDNYKAGWNFVGSTPPSRQMWDFLQKQNDEKAQYLLNNFENYLPLSGGTLTGEVFGVTPPNGDNSKKIANTEFIQALASILVPVGCVQAYAGNTVPNGWLLCDGSAVSRTDYADLYVVIGDTYGSGDGSTTFNLPNLVNKFVEGSATSGTEHSAGLPNIVASIDEFGSVSESNSPISLGGSSVDGAFYKQNQGSAFYLNQPQTVTTYTGLGFDASRSNSIYGNSNTVQPPALTMRYIIKY
jgi:microcystin-dependent protein